MKQKPVYVNMVLALFFSLSAIAQQRISGTVSDSTGQPLPGATVTVKGTNTNAVTDVKGQFTINAPIGSTLLVSYVGYDTQEIPVSGAGPITVQMQNSGQELESTVVIGYQTVRRRDLTGATGIVDMNSATRITAGSVGESIQGLVPGVTVRNTGAPGQNPTIEIRGVASFNNVSPLYVIDGMLADANTTINSDDIASIQILKDASAAAIYGSRAGNGVIIITTKKGKNGPARISFSAKYGIQQIPHKWKVMNTSQYLKTVQQEYQNSGVALPSGIAAQVANNTVSTDWQDAVYRTGSAQDYNVSISGGSATGNYFISGSYYDNTGILIGNSFQRATLRVNSEGKKGRLTVGENIVLSNTLGRNPGSTVNAFYESPTMLPIVGVQGDQYKSIQYNPAGWGMGTPELPTFASNYLAVAALDKQTYNFDKVVGNAYVDLKLTNWLSYRFNPGLEVSFDYHKEVRDTGIWRFENQPPLTSVSEDRERFTNLLLEHTLNFNKTFGEHAINGVVGFSRTEHRRDVTGGGRSLLQNANGQLFTTVGSASGVATASGGTPLFWRNHGYLGRINYSYADRYLLTLTGRIDQDSRFGSNYRTGKFPSVAAAWRISRENFFSSAKSLSWVNDLKLRASYGKLGFSDVLGSWDYLGVLNNFPRAVYGVGQTPLVGEYQAQIANQDLRWETRIQKNIGLDFSLLNNRLSGSIDVYNALSKDVLVLLPVPMYLGSTGSAFANAGSIRNTGVEFAATYRSNNTGAKSKNLKWDVSANFTTIKNRVLSVGSQGTNTNYLESSNHFIRAQVGHSIGQWYVIRTAGIFKSQDEINNYVDKNGKLIQPNAKPGDIKFVDSNADGIINNNDRQYAGSPWPTLQAGAQFNLYYHQFNVNLQFIGVFGDKLYNDIRRVLDSYQLTNFRKNIDPWSPTNTNGKDPRLAVDQPTDPGVSQNNMPQSDRWLENGSYVRLRNVEIGYTLPTNLLSKVNFSSARLYISGQNLFTITKYKGLDPDVQGSGILERGFDVGNWPNSRVISIGLQGEF